MADVIQLSRHLIAEEAVGLQPWFVNHAKDKNIREGLPRGACAPRQKTCIRPLTKTSLRTTALNRGALGER